MLRVQYRPLSVPDCLGRTPVYDDIAAVALPQGHSLASIGTVSLTDLAGEAWISWQDGSICHDWLMQTLCARGREPRVQHFALE